MAKGKYQEWLTPEGLLRIEGWARDGLTDEQIAGKIGINPATLYEWKNKYPEISETLKRGKEVVDRMVENALLKRALGYEYNETTRERIVDTGQKKRHNGESKLTEKDWEFAVKYFNGRCAYCGEYVSKPTKDHLKPLHEGGTLTRDNVVPCCKSCNSSKKDNEWLSWFQKQAFYSKERAQKISDYIDFVIDLGTLLEEQTGQMVVTKEVTKQIVPDTTAQIFWLKNRKPKQWRDKIEPDNPSDSKEPPYNGIPATMIAPVFAPVLFDIQEHKHTEYVFPGGRGSTKSSFIGLNVVDLIMKNENMHAVVMRQVADTLRGSVYQQIMWAIEALGLSDEYHATVSPMEITRKSTGQKIYFRGADDPGKVKSIKVPFGYIGILWLEELDQFTGPEAVRKIEQSVIRGGDVAYIFKSFNPPKSASNWANKYIKIPKVTRLITWSNYTQVPETWLGKPFLDEATFLKEVNPTAYENEYLGVANGTGGMVFDNLVIREITDEEIRQFDRTLNGVDWGWYPDPYHFARCHYDAARLKLYIFMEYRCNKQSNKQTADKLKDMGITANDLITCDSAEEKSVGDYRTYGLLARGAEKGPGSVEYSMKWLQSLAEIVIDNKRCPKTAEEFMEYEYERDKEGEVISGYPDKNNHGIDAVRYATNPIWKKRGQ